MTNNSPNPFDREPNQSPDSGDQGNYGQQGYLQPGAQPNNYGYPGQNFGASYPASAQVPAQMGYHGAYPEQKSRAIAALLAFFLGGLGLHNFYLGQKNFGIIKLVMLVVGTLTSLILIGVVVLAVLGIWVTIDFVLILFGAGYMATDDRGVPTKW